MMCCLAGLTDDIAADALSSVPLGRLDLSLLRECGAAEFVMTCNSVMTSVEHTSQTPGQQPSIAWF